MTDNPTALPEPLPAASFVFYQKLVDEGPNANWFMEVRQPLLARWLATITAKDAEIAAQAETIKRLTKGWEIASRNTLEAEAEVATLRSEVAALKSDLTLVIKERDKMADKVTDLNTRAYTTEAEVAALREALLDMRSIVIGYWSMDMTPAEMDADETMTKARAALSPRRHRW